MLICTCLKELSLPYILPVLKKSLSDSLTASKGRGLSCVDPYPWLSRRLLSRGLDEGVALDGRRWDSGWVYMLGGLQRVGGMGRREDIGVRRGGIGRIILLSCFVGIRK